MSRHEVTEIASNMPVFFFHFVFFLATNPLILVVVAPKLIVDIILANELAQPLID